MVNAQEWLDNEYPHEQRQRIKKLLICNDIYLEHEVFQNEITNWFNPNIHYLTDEESLTGDLVFNSFPNLKKLMVKKQLINKLVLTNCSKLEEVYAEDNLLREIILPFNVRKLSIVSLVNNNFFAQDLSNFSRFTNLRFLHLGTNNSWRIINNVYNRWNGSLFHLRNLDNLWELDINATDIDSGLEYLPTNNLFYFTCAEVGRVNAGVRNIKQLCGFNEGEAVSCGLNDNLEKVRRINEVKQELRNQIEVRNI